MKTLSPAVAAAARASAPTKSEDKLKQARDLVAEARDNELKMAALAERMKQHSTRINEIKFKELPDLMGELQIKELVVDASGNEPAFAAKLKPYYKANISADWDADRQNRAFDWLTANKAGDMIKQVVTIKLGLGEEALGKKLFAALRKVSHKVKGRTQRIEFDVKRGVPHGTLTAYVKEQIEEHKTMPPLELLGATVGNVVDIKPVKEKN